jgi:peptide/nickel transport system permease protein
MAFVVHTVLPGDPARMVAGPQARPADVARIRTLLGLERPPIVQYVLFWRRLVHFGPRAIDPTPDGPHANCAVILAAGPIAVHVDLGRSFQLRQPVTQIVAARLPRTFALAVTAVLVQLAIGLTMGLAAAVQRGSRLDRLLVGTSVLGVSVPTFVIALLLQYAFAYKLRWLPLDGYGTTFAQHAESLVLPALTLGIYGSAYYTRLVRDEMSVLLRKDWVRTARAKGLPPCRVVVVHALRNALVPIVTVIGLDFGALMGGAIVTETMFRWPGVGSLSVQATLNRDGPVLLACVVATSMIIVATNVVVDAVCAYLGPRGVTSPGTR